MVAAEDNRSFPPGSLISPQALMSIRNLELRARVVVEGFWNGIHRSPYHGFSVEYLDHRAYAFGDDLRALDWKLLARTDKYHVKLFHDETNLRATILLDCSASMKFKTGALSKLEYGSYLTAALAHLMLRQNDAVGLVMFDREVVASLPPRARPSQFRQILDMLDRTQTGNDTDVGAVLHTIAERLKRRGLVIVISDLIDDEAKIGNGLQHFRHDKHEVVVFHVMDDAELTFPWDRITRFKDLEGHGRVVTNPNSLRARYLARLGTFLDGIKTACVQRSISYNLVNTKEPYEVFLAAYLEKRARIG